MLLFFVGQFLFRLRKMKFDLITIFPHIFDSYFNESIIKRAQSRKLVKIKIHNLRDYTSDLHQTVDDSPYGGGPGMVLMAEPIAKAVKDIKRRTRTKKRKVILVSAKGQEFNQKMAADFSKLDQLIVISGRYEGVDERVAKYIADKEVSIGQYVLTGGELPAMVIVDAVTRLFPGVIKPDSLKDESFTGNKMNCEYPHYTRPEVLVIDNKARKVPKVLLSGNHQAVEKWRQEHRTKKKLR